MTYATLFNSDNLDADVVEAIEIRPEGPCDVADLSSHDKMVLRESENLEKNLVVEPDGCLDNLQGTMYDNRKQQPKSPRNMNLQQTAKSGDGGFSSSGLPCSQKAVLPMGLLVFVLLLAVGDGASLSRKTFNIRAGTEVKLPFKCPSEYCLLNFRNSAESRDVNICGGKERDGSSGYTFDEADNLCFIANDKTAGSYFLIDYNTNEIVYSVELTVQSTAEEPLKSGATSNNLPNGLLMALAISVVLGYFFYQH